MERPITGFGVDPDGDPIAILSCGHPQHVRHNPPFINRPWVTTTDGRASMLGEVGFHTLANVIDSCTCFELEFGHLPDALDGLAELTLTEPTIARAASTLVGGTPSHPRGSPP